jgi:hypothetical protein
MKIARIICCELMRLDARLLKQGFDIIPTLGAGIDIICEFLTPEPLVRGGLGWGKKFTTPARIAI